MSDRAEYAVAGQAAREAIDAALEANLPPSAYRVLLFVLREVTTYSRTSDRLTRAQIAEGAGVSEREVKRTMARLVAAGAVEWVPARGRGQVSLVRLSSSTGGTASGPPSRRKGDCQESPLRAKKGDQIGQEGGPNRPLRGTTSGPPPEKTSEKTPEEGANTRDNTTAPAIPHHLDPFMARGAPHRAEDRHEFDAKLARLVDQVGPDRASTALAALQGRRFTFASDFDSALRQHLPAAPPPPPACRRCGGSRWDPDDWDDLAAAPRPCRACAPAPVP